MQRHFVFPLLASLVFSSAAFSSPTGSSEDCDLSQVPRYAYLANMNDDLVSVLDIETMQTVDKIEGFDSPYGIVVMPDNSKFYVDNAAGLGMKKQYVSVVDTCTRQVLKEIPVAAPLPVSAISRDGSTVYIAEVLRRRVLRIDTTTDDIVNTYTFPDIVVIAIPSPDNKTLWVGTVTGQIFVVDTDDGLTVGKPIKAPWSAGWLTFTPEGDKLVSVHAGPGVVALIDVATKTVTAKLELGKNSFPEYGAISRNGRYYWITLGDGNVVVVDLETMTKVVTLETGAFSFGVRLSPDGQRAFVTTVPHSTKLLTEIGGISTFLLLAGFWNPEGEVVIYDTTSFTELDRVPTANSATIMAYAGAEG